MAKQLTPPTHTGVLLLGLFLSVAGLLGAGTVATWAGSEWYGLSYPNTWPAILLLAWGGLSGVALCMRWKPANGSLVVWTLAFCTWMLVITWPSDGAPWVIAISLCTALLAAVIFVLRATPPP